MAILPDWAWWLVASVFIAGGLLLPGLFLTRLLRAGPGLLPAFVGSLALLPNLALLLEATGLGLTPLTFGIGVAALALPAIWLLARSPRCVARPGCGFQFTPAWWWWPVLAGFGAILFRVSVDPLSGYDNVFRWDFLARAIWRHGTMDFYPPHTAEDFAIYGWCDGIPPLVSLTNFWSYVCFGGTDPRFTFPRLMLETVMLFLAVRRLAEELAGKDAGWSAAALVACSPLLLWSVAIGQETGLTALSFAMMFALLFSAMREETGKGGFWMAGVAAGVGALSREYGLAWCVFGVVLLLLERRSFGEMGRFLCASVCVAAPWYLRNWHATGNPLWSHSLAGIFPVNAEHVALMGDIGALYRVRGHWAAFFSTLANLAPALGLLLPLFVYGVYSARARMRGPLIGIAGVFLLWLWSLHQTAAGWEYSMRMLSPAIAVAAAVAAGAFARVSGRMRNALIVLVCVCAIDAGIRSWHMPHQPWISPLRSGEHDWRQVSRDLKTQEQDPVWDRIAQASAGRPALTFSAHIGAYLSLRGVAAHPGISPAVDFLRDRDMTLDGALERLRGMGFRFVFLPDPNPLSDLTARRTPFMTELPAAYAPAASFYGQHIFDLDKLTPRASGAGEPASPASLQTPQARSAAVHETRLGNQANAQKPLSRPRSACFSSPFGSDA